MLIAKIVSGVSGGRKSLLMLLGGLCFAAVGLLWSTVMPFNRSIWTSSHIVFSTGYALSLFATFYWIVDVKGWRGWTFPFRVIGMNSLLIFLVQRFSGVNLMDAPAHALFDGVVKLCPESLGKVVFAAGYVAVCWLFLLFLYRKKRVPEGLGGSKWGLSPFCRRGRPAFQSRATKYGN